MNKRSLWVVVGAVVLGLAACNDDETTPTEPPPQAVINSLSITPASAFITVGGTVTLVADVDATGQIDLSVTWASADPSVATVDAAGIVTAVAPGDVAITATSVANPAKGASAHITVVAFASATVSIKSITTATGAAVNPDAVTGLINVTLNVDPGDHEIAKVELLMDGEVVGSQVFASPALAPAGEPQAPASAEIAFAFNTAGVRADGLPLFLNVEHVPGARLQLKDGTSVSAKSEVKPLTFANENVAGKIKMSGTSAENAEGDEWFGGGDVTLSYQPTIYDPTSPSTVRFTITAGPEVFTNGKTYIDAPLGEKNTYSAVIPKSDIANSANLTEDADVPIKVSSSRIPSHAPHSFRLDNKAPSEPDMTDYLFQDVRTGTDFPEHGKPVNSWANASTEFSLDDAGLDGGVGEVDATLNVFTYDAFTGKDVPGPVVHSGADLAETSSFKYKIGVTELKDVLGNETTLSSSQVLSEGFAVDKTPPSITSVKPSGVAVLNPASDEVCTFKIRDTRSGLDIDERRDGGMIDSDAQRFFKAELAGVSVTPGDNVFSVTDGTKDRIDVSLTVAGANDAANDGLLSVWGQMIDQAGNVATLPGLSTTTDNTEPSVPITGAPPATINANGAATLTVLMTGSINDASGIAAAEVRGEINGVAFTVNDANVDIISLGEGGFAASYVLKSKGAGASPEYAFNILAKDNAENLDGDQSPNTTTVTLRTKIIW